MKPLLFLLAFAPGAVLLAGAAPPEDAAPPILPTARGFAPYDYFEERCARCHGSKGSNYGENFAKGVEDEKLREIIAEMAAGPAEKELSDPQLDVMMAWHLSLRDKTIFAALGEATDGGDKTILSGEATPGATLTLQSGEKSWKAERKEGETAWTATIDGHLDLDQVKLTAKLGEDTQTWALPGIDPQAPGVGGAAPAAPEPVAPDAAPPNAPEPDPQAAPQVAPQAKPAE